mgnify:CR=1 FL=1
MAERSGMTRTEEAVYEAAVELMSARGFHGTSQRDVAGAVGMHMSSLYHYFPSKQAMLVAIMRRTMEDLHAFVEPEISAGGTPRERLLRGIRAHVLFHADRRRETIIADSEIRALEDGNRDAVIALRDRYGALFRDVLEDGKRAGVFRFGDAHVATNALMTMCAGVATWYSPTGRLTLDEIADEIAGLFLEGITPAG